MVDERRTALVTGGSRGIGRALAEMLGEEGYALTISGRRPEALATVVEEMGDRGFEVQGAAGDVADEQAVAAVVAAHLERFGRLDVLVNSAGVGVGAPIEETATKDLDLMTAVNLRSIVLAYREATPALLAAGAEHGNALVLNLASMAGVEPKAWIAIYSATKGAVRAFTTAMNRELGERGVKSTALSPGFVDTDMTEYMHGQLPPERMIATADLAEMARGVLHTSRWCVIPEIQFTAPFEVRSAPPA
jgi:NAD(P)-dependent dehydrogenase (short-subunit alcohol dehydrogenase family)